MADAASEAAGNALAKLDLCDAELYRHGFPHERFATLRREAPIWWQGFPDGVAET